MKVKVVGQRSRSNVNNSVLISLLHCFKVGVKGRGQGQRSGSMSKVDTKVMGQSERSRSNF